MPKPIGDQADFNNLIKRGRRATLGNFSLWYIGSGAENHLTVIISAKQGNAVKRNKARRLVKEVIRQNKPKIKQGWRLAIKINAPLLDNYVEAEQKVFELLYKAGLIENDFKEFD